MIRKVILYSIIYPTLREDEKSYMNRLYTNILYNNLKINIWKKYEDTLSFYFESVYSMWKTFKNEKIIILNNIPILSLPNQPAFHVSLETLQNKVKVFEDEKDLSLQEQYEINAYLFFLSYIKNR